MYKIFEATITVKRQKYIPFAVEEKFRKENDNLMFCKRYKNYICRALSLNYSGFAVNCGYETCYVSSGK